MSFEQTGRITYIGEVETFGAKGFQKQTVVINNEDNDYPVDIPFTFAGKKADVPGRSGVIVGDKVTVHFQPQGREYNGKWYAEHAAWRIDRHGATRTQQKPDFDPNQAVLDEEPPF